jgi:hypothetical protein
MKRLSIFLIGVLFGRPCLAKDLVFGVSGHAALYHLSLQAD